MDQMPPNDVAAEQSLIGTILVDGSATLDRVSEHIKLEDFYNRNHAAIYGAAIELHTQGLGVDMVTVSSQLKRDGHYDQVGGAVYLADLATRHASVPSNAAFYARNIVDAALSRALSDEATQTAKEAREQLDDPRAVITSHTDRLQALLDRPSDRGGFRSMDELMSYYHQELLRIKAEGITQAGLSTGLKDLDELLGGWQKSDLIILAGRPGMGKTAAALTFALNAAKEGHPIGFFSLEMANDQVVARLVSMVGKLRLDLVNQKQIKESDMGAYDSARELVASLPIYIDDTPGLHYHDLTARAKRLAKRHKVELLVVDYLQLVHGSTSRQDSREQEVSRATQGLKALAKSLNVPVLALAQLSRSVELRADKRPELSDLRESGSIEQEADVVAFLYRPSYYGIRGKDGEDTSGTASIIIRKQRNGPTGELIVAWADETATMADIAPAYWADTAPPEQKRPVMSQANGKTHWS